MIDKNLSLVDLVVDEIYGGSRNGNASDDVLPTLLGVDSGAGFRHLGQRPNINTLKLLVLKTSFKDLKWPDSLDRESGLFVYFGDKRKPGELHDTPRLGNQILRNLFDELHSCKKSTAFPPILIFGNTGTFRDLQFLGLAVPGAAGMTSDEDLVAVWRTTVDGIRFQNYKATFTILDVSVIKRAWIYDIQHGHSLTSLHAPKAWLQWVSGRKYSPLKSLPSYSIRSKDQQIPKSKELIAYIELIREFYINDYYSFEKCSMEIARLFMPNIHSWEVTRPWRDGGRDAIGTYKIGENSGGIEVDFALEAKCYSMSKGVGVKSLSRLISRLRHRQFGILVTTSYLDSQAYQELMMDKHPVVVISANDIAMKLREKFGSLNTTKVWLESI